MLRLGFTALALVLASPLAAETPLTLLDGQPPGFMATLSLDDAGLVQGRAPCNRYSARWMGPLPTITLDAILSTKMACPEIDAEQRFFELLSLMDHAETAGDSVTLSGAGHVLVFSRLP